MKNKLKIVVLLSLSSLILSGCVRPSPEGLMTQLQVREIQTRDFDTNDSKLVMKSMMNVLQDEGFIIKNAVSDLGLLNAEKHIDIEDKVTKFFAVVHAGSNARWSKQKILEASANVSEFGCNTRVRINFQVKTLDNFGCPQEVITLMEASYYQDFFEKVSKGLFLQQQAI